VIVGTTALSTPPEFFPAGAVASFSGPSAMLLDGIVFEPAGLAGGAARRDSSSNARLGGSLEDLSNQLD
jgi:hypothetical protein